MKNFLIQSAYFLKNSLKYHRLKNFFYNLLENPNSKMKTCFDIVMLFFVTGSVFFIIHDSHSRFSTIDRLFETTVVILFISEYLLRGWLHSHIHQLIIEYYEKNRYLNLPFKWSEI